MFWWPIAQHLSEFLKLKPEFVTWQVYPGSKGSAKEYPCIEVQWDDEANLSIHKKNKGDVVLWVDIWVLSDEIEAVEVYQQQYDAQMAIFDSLKEWSDKLCDDLGLSVKIECPGIASAGTITRPSFGCRIILNIEWRSS